AFNDLTFIPTATLLLNRPDSPGDFLVQPPIPLVDDTPTNSGGSLQLEASKGGPGIVSGRLGDPSIGIGAGIGGANYITAIGDFNADGSPDLVVTGTALINGINYRSSLYLIGNETEGTVRVSRPQRIVEYGTLDPFKAGGDTFIACLTANFSAIPNGLPDVLH